MKNVTARVTKQDVFNIAYSLTCFGVGLWMVYPTSFLQMFGVLLVAHGLIIIRERLN